MSLSRKTILFEPSVFRSYLDEMKEQEIEGEIGFEFIGKRTQFTGSYTYRQILQAFEVVEPDANLMKDHELVKLEIIYSLVSDSKSSPRRMREREEIQQPTTEELLFVEKVDRFIEQERETGRPCLDRSQSQQGQGTLEIRNLKRVYEILSLSQSRSSVSLYQPNNTLIAYGGALPSVRGYFWFGPLTCPENMGA